MKTGIRGISAANFRRRNMSALVWSGALLFCVYASTANCENVAGAIGQSVPSPDAGVVAFKSPPASVAPADSTQAVRVRKVLRVIGASSKFNLYDDYKYDCNHAENGSGYGSYGWACDADVFGDTDRIMRIYSPAFVYDRRKDNQRQRKEYVTNMYALIKQVATNYYLHRSPNASEKEIAAWVAAIAAMSSQETKMSHYRLGRADGVLKIEAGDGRKSLGMMQFYQSQHGSDESVDLAGHVARSAELLYDQWVSWASSSCHDDLLKTNPNIDDVYIARASGAYAGYNSGYQVCRYTHPESTYALNDKLYLEELRDPSFMKFVRDPNRKIRLDTECLIDGDDVCARAVQRQPHDAINERPLVVANGATCLTQDGLHFDCAQDIRTFSCLMLQYPAEVLEATPLKLNSLKTDWKVVDHERIATCQNSLEKLAIPGDMITLKRRARVLSAAQGGVEIARANVGEQYQVLDFEVATDGKGSRYYQVKLDADRSGWIFAGTNANADSLMSISKSEASVTVASPVPPTQSNVTTVTSETNVNKMPIPVIRSEVTIVAANGIYMTEQAEAYSKRVMNVPRGTSVHVDGVFVQGTDNQIYLQIEYGGHQGYIYAGHTYPSSTVEEWVR